MENSMKERNEPSGARDELHPKIKPADNINFPNTQHI
jgi:hypothetical protein